MNRPLGVMERALGRTDTFAPLTVVALLRLTHAPTPDALRGALARLQARHPLLRARITAHRHFSASPHTIPLQVLPRRDDSHWHEIAERELNTRVASERGPLLRCSYLWDSGGETGPARGDLCLAFHHAVVDGVSGTLLLDELLTDIAGEGGDPGPPGDGPFPAADRLVPSGSTTLQRRLGFIGRQLGGELATAFAARGPRPTIPHSSDCGLLSRDLDAATAAALAQRSRRSRLGLASVVHAAMMLALHERRGGGRSQLMTGVSFADLRPYLTPPVADTVLGCYIAMLRFVAPVAAGSDRPAGLWTLADRIQTAALQAGRRGDKFAAAVTTDWFMRLTLALKARRMGDTALSYAGPIPIRERYGEVVVDGVHGFISNNALGPVFTAQARLFAGRLRLDVVHLHHDLDRAEAAALTDDTLALLTEAARQSA